MPYFTAVIQVIVTGMGENPQAIEVTETWTGKADDFAEAAVMAIESVPNLDRSVVRKYGEI